MLNLDEAKKFKWNIIYQYVPEHTEHAKRIIEGQYYDFIPDKGELLILDNVLYTVVNKMYDFDQSNIVIILNKLNDNVMPF